MQQHTDTASFGPYQQSIVEKIPNHILGNCGSHAAFHLLKKLAPLPPASEYHPKNTGLCHTQQIYKEDLLVEPIESTKEGKNKSTTEIGYKLGAEKSVRTVDKLATPTLS